MSISRRPVNDGTGAGFPSPSAEPENVEAEPVLDDADEAEAAPAPKSRKRAAKNTPTED